MLDENIKYISQTIEEAQQKAEAELLACYPKVNELYNIIDTE